MKTSCNKCICGCLIAAISKQEGIDERKRRSNNRIKTMTLHKYTSMVVLMVVLCIVSIQQIEAKGNYLSLFETLAFMDYSDLNLYLSNQ